MTPPPTPALEPVPDDLRAEHAELSEVIDGHRLRFDDDLIKTTVAADAKLASLLSRLDGVANSTGLSGLVDEPEPFEPLWPAFVSAPSELHLKAAGIDTVVWATGYRRTYSWLKLPLLDARGELLHHGGITPVAGVYAIGLPFQRTRKSTFIDGVGSDARVLAAHIAARLGQHHDLTHYSAVAV
jgi:putative flavoprotein involved in K+ transport